MEWPDPVETLPAAVGASSAATSLGGFNQPGVYFLYLDDVVVYVGQGVNVRSRIGQHISEGVKHFDFVSFIPCRVSILLKLEQQFIEALKPLYNRTRNPAAFSGMGGFGEDKTAFRFTMQWMSLEDASLILRISLDEVAALVAAGVLDGHRSRRSNKSGGVSSLDVHRYLVALRSCVRMSG